MNKSSAAGAHDSALAASRSVGIGWSDDLPVELVTEDDDVLAVAGKRGLLHVAGIPDPCLAS